MLHGEADLLPKFIVTRRPVDAFADTR